MSSPRLPSHPGSVAHSFDVRDRPSIFLLSPDMIVPDSPKHNHEEDRSGPVEVLGIGVREDGEEHENEQRGLEREGTEVSRKQKSASERA